MDRKDEQSLGDQLLSLLGRDSGYAMLPSLANKIEVQLNLFSDKQRTNFQGKYCHMLYTIFYLATMGETIP